jgi:hypothetical protein
MKITKKQSAKNRRLSPDELVALAERMVSSKAARETERLKKQMERGFYGDATCRRGGPH